VGKEYKKQMIFDKDGKEISPAAPHKFGHFIVPDDTRLTLRQSIGIEPTAGYWLLPGGMGWRQDAEPRADYKDETK
jgi:hypothetical protein